MMTAPIETVRRRLAAVWFADLVDYTCLSRQDGDTALAAVGVQVASREVLADHEGRIVKFVGDVETPPENSPR